MQFTRYTEADRAQEPITLERAKAHLRVIDDSEDDLLRAYIAAARAHVEAHCGIRLIAATVTAYGAKLPAGGQSITLPVAPVLSVASVETLAEGAEDYAALDADDFRHLEGSNRVQLDANFASQSLAARDDAVRIIYTAGYGADAGKTPASLVTALLFLVAHYFENRVPVVIGASAVELPLGVQSLLRPFKQIQV
ncbi:head-tail connector protein [Cerasicoccus frondis]|uniref:head-tail connector protein n=1 Tax=Cerasicoccus frondis TaxID=490090 RepID=UPI002852BFFA|nr:head-tail connector protein [Cerasicoccus frondis]